MSRKNVVPEITVKHQVVVDLSAEATEHALRCWLAHTLAPARVPVPVSLSDVFVRVQTDDDGNLVSASFTYTPVVEKTPTVGEGVHDSDPERNPG